MAIDAGIYNALAVRPKSVTDFQNDYAQQDKNALMLKSGQLDYQNALQAQMDDKAYRSAIQGFGDDKTANYNMLIRSGLGKQAQAYQKAALEAQEAQSKIGKEQADTQGKKIENARKLYEYGIQSLQTAQDPMTAAQLINDGVNAGHWDVGAAQRMLQSMPKDPAAFGDWRIKQLAAITEAAKQLPTIQNRDTGGAVQTLSVDPFTGKPTVTGSVAKTQSPDNIASNQLGWANNSVARARLAQDQAQFAVTSGQKERELGQADNSGLPALGVPVPTVYPWSNQSNPKDANKVKLAEQNRGAKDVEKDSDAARKEAEIAKAAARFIELNKTVGTGGVTDKIGITRALKSMGSDYSELESITAKLAPGMREPGSGSSSDYDGRQFERATVGVDKPQKTNENIAKAVIARAQQSQDYADFRQTYLEQNGTLQGADRYWKKYADANPIFDPKKPDSFDLNAKRTSWRDHFKGGAPAGGGKQSSAPAAAPAAPAAQKSVVRTGTHNGRKVVQYSDGTMDYAD